MTDDQTSNRTLILATIRLLRPLVRILIRNGIPYGTFAELAKWLFADVARKDFAIKGRKQTISRISVITGLTRKDVKRLLDVDHPVDQSTEKEYHRAARVISGWIRCDEFLDAKGNPAVLPISGGHGTFNDLVRRFSGDMPPRAVLDELHRVGIITREGNAGVRLLERSYIPLHSDHIKHDILGTDVSYLIATIEHNLKLSSDAPFFQRKVIYDNLPDEVLPKFKKKSFNAAQRFLEKLDEWLSRNDRDINPDIQGTGRNTAGMGIYYFEEPYQKTDE